MSRITVVSGLGLILVCSAAAWGDDPVEPKDCSVTKQRIRCGYVARWMEAHGRDGDKDGRGPGDPQVETSWTDVLHTKIDIDISMTARTINGSVTITAESRIDGLGQFVAYLDPNGGQMSVSSVSGNVAGPTSFTHVGDKVTVMLDAAYSTGQQFTVTFNYGGVAAVGGPFWGNHGSPSVPIMATNSEPFYARYWWVGKDVLNEKCTFDIWVTIPNTHVVASNGILRGVDTVTGNKLRYRWEETYPMASYLLSLAIADYQVYSTTYNHLGETMPMNFYMLPEHNTPTWRGYCDTYVTMTEVFSDLYGQYPFIAEKGGMAETPTMPWYMEHQTLPSMPSFSTRWINAHELSHQWWGDNVTCETWNDIWLNEGFASYSECLWQENKPAGGKSPFWSHLNNYDRPSNPDALVWVTDVNDDDAIFDDNAVYNKGAWVVHMLRHVMDDAAFYQALADYRAQYAGGSATTAEFTASMSTSFGHDLSWFINQWVMKPGSPDYEWNYSTVLLGGQQYLRLAVWQKQSARGYGLITMPIDIRVTTAVTGAKTYKIWNDAWTEYYVIPIDDSPSNVEFDEEDGYSDRNWVLFHGRTKVTTTLSSPPAIVAAEFGLAAPPANSTFALTFSENVGSFDASDVSLVGHDVGPRVPQSVTYNATAQQATMVYSSLAEDLYTFTVLASGVAANGKSLDGEVDASNWWDTTLLPSGDGQPGGNAVFVFGTLVGDIDGDGDVDFDDLDAFVAVLVGNPLNPAHAARSDLNGDGTEDGGDIQLFVDHML